MNILFTVCGRAGSKGCKSKNVRSLHGVPLVYHTLAAIKLYKDAHPNDNVVTALNTDSEELQQLVRNQNMIDDIIFVPRKEELADSVSAKVDVIKDTYFQVKEQMRVVFDVVVDLDITAPMRSCADVENSIKELFSRAEYDLVYSVVPSRKNPYFNMVQETPDGFYKKVCHSNYTARQQTPKIYDMNASIYAYRPAFLEMELDRTISEYNCGIVIMPDYLVLDIDSEDDLKMMEYLYNYYVEHDSGLKEVFEVALNGY